MNIFKAIVQKVKEFVNPAPTPQKTIDPYRNAQLNAELSTYRPSNLSTREIVKNLDTVQKPTFKVDLSKAFQGLQQQFDQYISDSEKARKVGLYGAPVKASPAIENFKKNTIFKTPVFGGLFKTMLSPSDETRTATENFYNDKATPQDIKSLQKEDFNRMSGMIMGMTAPIEDIGAKASPLIKKGAQVLASKLEGEAGPFTKLQKAFRSLDPQKRLSYLAGKFSEKEMIEMPASKAWAKIEGKTIENMATKFADEAGLSVKSKVNLLDYLRTPSTVFSKMGLKPEFQSIRLAHDTYLDELPKEISKITEWSKQVSPESNKLIFQYLDGKAPEKFLDKTELKVATEIKGYLSDWAEKLKLPKDKRLSNYITHIFKRGEVEQEFDPEFAKLIRDKVAGSTYDPFLQKRGDAEGYIQDTWQALDAYTKRAVRKYWMDPALEKVKTVADDLETSQFNYVKNFIDRVQMRPTDIDNLLDNTIKSSPIGYKFGQRPTTAITQKARQAVYKGLIGLNPASALRNLSQGANTYAELGEKYTLKGYTQVAKNLKNFVTGADSELEKVGVLKNSFIEDRTLNATRKTLQKLDDGLFYMFNLAEKVNRGAAYWGAKAQAIDKGISEEKAIEFAKSIVRKTQFNFGAIDTPVALQSDIAKTLLQFQSFGVKQVEFLGNKVVQKDFAGLLRYIGASLLFTSTIGKAVGMEWDNMIPFNSGISTTPPTLQLPKGIIETATGNENGPKDILKGGMSYIPAGGQILKSYNGLQSQLQGGVYSPTTGNLKYPSGNAVQDIMFGPTVGENAKKYFDKPNPLGVNQSDIYRSLVSAGIKPEDAYATATQGRTQAESLKKDISGQQSFNLFDLLKEKVFGTTKKTSTSRGDLLLDTLDKQTQVSDQVNEIKQIFQSGLSKDKIELVLQKRGLPNYEESSLKMMKTLPVDSGSRGNYLVNFLSGMTEQQYAQTVYKLAESEVLTTGVTAKWLDDGFITENQQKAFNKVISATKGKKVSSGTKSPAIRKISVSPIKASAPRKIIAPKVGKLPKSLLEEYDSSDFLKGFKTKL